MRSSRKAFVAIAAGLLVVPQLAAATDEEVQEQLRQMQERMSQLEDKLEATTDDLEASQRRVDEQQTLIERAGLEERAASSGMASFFEQVEFGGWVAASYFYNFNGSSNNKANIGNNFPGFNGGTGGAMNQGTTGFANPFHPNSNSFTLDQLWFEMSKQATEESRGGFAADLVMGETSDLLPGGGGDGNGNNVSVYQAYAEWLAPVGPGLRITGGRFATHIGAEVAQTVYNFNITRGLVYSVLQPVNHVGLKLGMEHENGIDWMVGISNDSLANNNNDWDNDKTFLWRVGYSQDQWSIALNGLWGGDSVAAAPNAAAAARCAGPPAAAGGQCRDNDSTGIVDLVLTWDPSENLSTWIDATYLWTAESKNGSASVDGFGFAAAGRLAITEAAGFAIRGEVLDLNGNYLGVGPGPGADSLLWSITGTLDYALTDALMVKGEVRYEEGRNSGPDKVFYNRYNSGGLNPSQNQVLLGAEMSYRF